MSDEEEMEEFGINDEDLHRAFNPGSRRNKMSKEEAMLGIWASKEYSDSEDEQDEFSYKNQFKKFSNKKSSNIDFVSSKSKQVNLENENESSQNNDDKLSDEEEFDHYKRQIIREELIEESNSDDNMEELSAKNAFILNQFQSQGKKTTQTFKPADTQKKFFNKKPIVPKSEIKEIGGWEKHTKGIGMKLMQKMGWEKGKGIGKEMQGRAVPVEATLRKGKAAVGAYGVENKESRNRAYEEEEEEEEVRTHVSQWKKDKKQKKPQYSLRTPEELIQIALKQPNKLKKAEQMLEMTATNLKETKSETITTNKIKIIDMTGKEQRITHGYESISHITKMAKHEFSEEKQKKLFDLPELTYNLDLILNMTEDKILHYDKKLKHYEDMIVNFSYEEKKTKEKINSENEQIEKIKNLINIIEKCESKVNEENVTLAEMIRIFQDLQETYPDEFLIFNLSQLSIPLLTPLLKRKMKLWLPFYTNEQTDVNTISYCWNMYSDLKRLLIDNNLDSSNISHYHRLVWETWMPAYRRIMSEISIKEFSIECVDIINKWSPLLSNWIVENIIEQVVLPKLTSEVEEWNPLTDTVPIHTWIHPWLPLLKDRLDSVLFPTIRFKLANALISWHPSDQSAKAILIPWKPPVFSITNWDQFIIKNILPKLELIFKDELVINPSKQNLDPWNWVMSWLDLVPLKNFIELMENFFFPKWLKVLSLWLNSSPDYEEVSKWYVGWKSLFCDKLAQHPNIKAKLSQGLLMMNRSVSGVQVIYNPNVETTKTVNLEEISTETNESLKLKGIQTTSTPAVSTFKDIIERKAAEHNLLFLPILNRFKEGKQVYRFGDLNIYIDRNVVFMLQNGNWIPASMNEIIQKAV